MTILKRHIVVPLGATLSTILVEQLGDTGAVTLATSPIVAGHSVLHRSLLFLLRTFFVLKANGFHTDHKLVLTKDHVGLGTTTLGFRDRIHRSTKVDTALRVVKVR